MVIFYLYLSRAQGDELFKTMKYLQYSINSHLCRLPFGHLGGMSAIFRTAVIAWTSILLFSRAQG